MEILTRTIKMIKKKLIKKWDPEYTKVTFMEKVMLKKSDIEIARGKHITEDEVWKE